MRSNSDTIFSLLKHEDIDFVALAMTPWHAIGIDAFLFEKSKEMHRKIKGIVLIFPNNDKYVVHEKNFSCKNFAQVNFYHVESLFYQKFANNIPNLMYEGFAIIKGIKNCRNNKNNKILYLISPWTPYLPFIEYFKDKEISNKYKPLFVIVDEGIGMYISRKSPAGIKHAAKFSRFAEIKLKSYDCADKFLRKVSMRYVPLDKRFVFEYKTDFRKNKDIVNSYKKIIELKSNDFEINEKNVALIITQPLSEHKIFTEKQEYGVIKEIIQLFTANKIKVLIKLHPYEAKNKYDYLISDNVKIIKDNFPVEEIIPNINPLCVIGATSTALITSKLIFNITAISILNLLNPDNESTGSETYGFKELSTEFVYFLDSTDEIIELLNLNTNQKESRHKSGSHTGFIKP